MSCGVCGFQAPLRDRPRGEVPEIAFGTARARAVAPRTAAPIVVAGTLDFAWPIGTKLRVAFQRPPLSYVSDEEFSAAKLAFGRCAVQWQTSLLDDLSTGASDAAPFAEARNALSQAVAGDVLPSDPVALAKQLLPRQDRARAALDFVAGGIAFRFDPAWDLDPPMKDEDAPVDRNRSSFEPHEPVTKPYDLLISFDDLPIKNTEAFVVGNPNVEYKLPISELGSYARRTDYGEPTMYVGRFGRYLKFGLREYLKTDFGRHVLLHEIGHALGLAHSHQNPLGPDRSNIYKKPEDAIALMNKLLGLDLSATNEVDRATLEGHLVSNWPGNPDFSYWSKPAAPIEKLDSVMAFPYHACMLADHAGCDCCTNPDGVHGCSQIPTTPTPSDIADLKALYYPLPFAG